MPKQIDELLAICPGVCGEIARTINASLEDSQPAMSIAAALSFVATLKCGRVVSDEGIEPNLYALMIADSGSGKSQVQKALTKIIDKAELNSLMLGKPASDAGMLKALSTNSRRLLIWDEFGIALSELANSKTGYRALILGLITDLFSSAGGIYYGKEYATQNTRIDIRSPYLNIFASSTGGRFFSSLNEEFVEDGFLSRWLVFFANEKTKEHEPRKLEITKSMLDAITYLQQWEAKKIAGNLSKACHEVEKKTATIEYLGSYQAWKKNFKDKAKKASGIERIFWTRARELFVKICLIVCETSHVTSKDVIFANELVELCIASQIARCETRLGETKLSRERERFSQILKPGEWLTRSQIARKAWRLSISLSERNELLKDLVDDGTWVKKLAKGEKKSVEFYAKNS